MFEPLAFLKRYRGDFLLISLALGSLLISCILLSPKKPFWNDEVIAWMVQTDPSWVHMLRALAFAVDGSPPAYHLIARVWLAIFGDSVLSLRLFSSAGFCVALIVLWITLRRYYGLRAVAFGLLTVWCTSDLVFGQNAEARNYGLFFVCCSLAIALFDVLANRERPPAKILCFAGVTTAVLVMTHYFGIIYSGMMLLALVLWDRSQQHFRPLCYAAIIAGWTPLLLWLKPMARLSELTRPRTYFKVPGMDALLRQYRFHISILPLIAFMAAVALTILALRKDPRPHDRECTPSQHNRSSPHPVLFVGLAFVAVPLLEYVVAKFSEPLYMDRYMLPSSLGFAILLVAFAERLIPKVPLILPDAGPKWLSLKRIAIMGWMALFGGLLYWPIQQARIMPVVEPVNTQIENAVPANTPVIVEQQFDWLQATFYAKPGWQYYYVLDRELARKPHGSPWESFFYNERITWKNNGYWADRTIPYEEFLCNFDRFAVVEGPGLRWFQERIRDNPAFSVYPLGAFESLGTHLIGSRYIWAVSRNPGQQLPLCSDHAPGTL